MVVEKPDQIPEQAAQIQHFAPTDDLTIQTSVLTAPLEPQFDFNLLYHLQAGMQRSQEQRAMHHRGPQNPRGPYVPNFRLPAPSSHDKFLGRI